jgi:DNA-binding beta-propeller fold protein YncE
LILLLVLSVLYSSGVIALPRFIAFESGQVRPLTLSPSGRYLYAVNTPANSLEVFAVTRLGLWHLDSIPVGLEPVAVAARNDSEVWVTNLLSDSVSVVDVSNPLRGRVVRTLLVGDEPRDIVFAGPGGNRAFITTAHRGQNIPFDPKLTTPGVGRADVWVFDARDPGPTLTGTPIAIVNLFSDTPRALAVSPDKSKVYAAAFHSGNRTTVASQLPGPFELPAPTVNVEGRPQAPEALIVKYDGQHWVDELGRNFDARIMFNLPDKDVFVIDAAAPTPRQLSGSRGYFTGVGTILYNMAVNPVTGRIYVSNTEARNEQRFEGPGELAGHSVRGHHNLNRISVLDGSQQVLSRHLNKHIDYSNCCTPPPNAESRLSLALPTGLAVSADGRKLYVAALGSSKVGVYDTAALENDSFIPNQDDQIALSGGGPTGLVLDERNNRLYVMTRFDNGIAVLDVRKKVEVAKVKLFNPEPEKIVRGRRFLYDATLSSKGDSACATCHVFADNDSLAWDLGNPDQSFKPNYHPVRLNVVPPATQPDQFAPMKGPMTTQSLRGMANHGAMHWRGDRTGAFTAPNIQPDSGTFDEREAFRQFQGGFTDLLGRPSDLPAQDMEAFTDFVLQLTYPPNPIRNLDDSLTPQQALGRDTFFNRKSVTVIEGTHPCQDCHRTDPNGNAEFGVEFPGFFGTDGFSAREGSTQLFKIAHFRNAYTKIGMFGAPASQLLPTGQPLIEPVPGAEGFMGDQVRGFGFSHSGEFDIIPRFISAFSFTQNPPSGFNPEGIPSAAAGLPMRRAVESFLYAFPTNLKPIVGQQATLSSRNAAAVASRVDLLIERANAGDCDLVAKGEIDGVRMGFLYVGADRFRPDRERKPLVTNTTLRASVRNMRDSITYTCVPPGSGYRIGIDRDNDGRLDGDERASWPFDH